jgi:hypothetical protein
MVYFVTKIVIRSLLSTIFVLDGPDPTPCSQTVSRDRSRVGSRRSKLVLVSVLTREQRFEYAPGVAIK